jgi:hypothetical protein
MGVRRLESCRSGQARDIIDIVMGTLRRHNKGRHSDTTVVKSDTGRKSEFDSPRVKPK